MGHVETYQDVMVADPVFGPVWARPGLSRRDRRFVTLTCVCASESVGDMNDHAYAALASGDITYDELLEFVLHFAVYCGWPRGSEAETTAPLEDTSRV